MFSLAYQNGELESNDLIQDDQHMPSHRVERVILKASKTGVNIIDLYSHFGKRHFIDGVAYNNELIREVLEKNKLNPGLIAAADDVGLDVELIESSQSALEAVGDDIGVPAIIFTDSYGANSAFFGPVLGRLPDPEQSVKLWDSLVGISAYDAFYELKRGRGSSGPDVLSTDRGSF